MSDESEGSENHYFESYEAIEKLFNYNPRVLTTETNWVVQNAKAPSPFWFYDKHLDQKLSLLRIKSMPSLTKNISDAADIHMKAIEDREIELPLIGPGSRFFNEGRSNEATTTLTDARSVARFYLETTAAYCAPLASTLILHPQAPRWMTAFTWSQRAERGSPAWMSEGYSLRPLASSGTFVPSIGLSDHLESTITEKMQDLVDRLPHLGTWEIGAVSDKSEALLREMSAFFPSKPFSPEICGTVIPDFITAATLSCTPDARSGNLNAATFMSQDAGLPTTSLRRSARLASSAKPIRQAVTNKRSEVGKGQAHEDVRPLASPAHSTRVQSIIAAPRAEYNHLTVERLLQHAWTRSVKDDTTIIVFHCGNFERIGIRHRESQTLFLSDVVDVVNGKDPAYGKLHTGLFIAAIEDAFDRAQQLQEIEANSTPGISNNLKTAKRPAEDSNQVKRRTRRKIGAVEKRETPQNPSVDPIQAILREGGTRNLALVRVIYGVFNSPSPASFLRIGRSLSPLMPLSKPTSAKVKYSMNECFTLILNAEIGVGSTGVLHHAKLEISMGNNLTSSHDIVVKLAFTDEQRERMNHEYRVYSHMASSGVQGCIPDVYGLFEDLEGGALALLMSHEGKTLWEHSPADDPGTEEVKVSGPVRSAFLRAMSSIHDAGVRHNDIRPDNLLVNPDDKVTIIDFDRAILKATKGQREREYANLERLLNGDYLPPGPFLSDATPQDSDSDGTSGTTTPKGSVGYPEHDP